MCSPDPLFVVFPFTHARARRPVVFPSDDSVIRHSASLHWLPRATVRQLHRYYQSAPTSLRPSRPAPFRSLGRYHALLLVARQRGVAVSGPSSVLTPVPQSSAFDSLSWRRRVLPGSSATPLRTCPALRPRRTGCAKATNDSPDIAFRSVDGVGSTISHISRLDHTACSLAVYASQLGLLRSNTTQDSLPTGSQPYWGRTLTCWVASGGFRSVSSTHIAFPSSKLFLAHQPP